MDRADRTAPRLFAAGAALLALLPLVMAVANRSSPVVVGLSALLFLAGALAESGREALRDLVARPLATPLGLGALAFLGWCLVSLSWSPFPAVSLRALREFGPTLVGTYILARLAPGRLPSWTALLAAGALGLAGLVIVAELATELPLRRALGLRLAEFAYNRPALTILLVAGPLAAVLAGRGYRILAAAIVVVCSVAILRSVSGAAALGLAAGLAMILLALVLPKWAALGIAGLGLGLAVALSPVEGDLLHHAMPEAAHERLFQSSSRARVAIARSFGAAVAADPWRGAGYGTGARFAETPVARTLAPEMREMLAVGHPHNSFLQVWAELGIVGAVLASLVMLLTLATLRDLPRRQAAAALGLVAAAAAVAFVEHGAWQAWWTASLGAAICWLRESFRGSPEQGREPA